MDEQVYLFILFASNDVCVYISGRNVNENRRFWRIIWSCHTHHQPISNGIISWINNNKWVLIFVDYHRGQKKNLFSIWPNFNNFWSYKLIKMCDLRSDHITIINIKIWPRIYSYVFFFLTVHNKMMAID